MMQVASVRVPRRRAFGDVVPGEFEVDATGMGAQGPVDFEEAGDFGEDVVEVTVSALAVVEVLACIGSHTQAAGMPLAVTSSTRGGSTSVIRWRMR